MSKLQNATVPILTALVTAILWALTAPASAEQVLFDFDHDFDVAAVEVLDTNVRLNSRGDDGWLRLTTSHRLDWPGVMLKAPRGRWDLSGFEHVAFDVKNVGKNRVEVFGRLDSPDVGGKRVWVQQSVGLKPGEKKTLEVAIKRRLPAKLAPKLFGMRGYPGGMGKQSGIDAGNVDQLFVFVARPSAVHEFEIDNIGAAGSHDPPAWVAMDEEQFFPMIDQYGQFLHNDWPGKTKSIEDLQRRQKEEAADLAAHPGPQDWNRYGGWQAGPQREATGHFRVEKLEGKWWLVDPEGRLFWSHGIDCVRSTTGYTPITDREFYFAGLPPKDSAFGPFYGRSNWAPHGDYQGKSFETYNFTGANLLRKYGPQWQPQFAEICHRRLRSWGMNTIGNWSDPEIYLLRKTPYVATAGSGRKPLEGSSGYWGKFPDVFDPDFRESLHRRLAAEKGKTAYDPWCIGYFVDNELSWGDELSLAVATLASPPNQAAKKVFVNDLKTRYETIERLNEAWGTEHASWEALLETQTPPDKEKAREDLAAFYTKTAEQYFRTCREAVKEVAPNTLYLGCRFAWVNDRAVRAAAKYSDVISFNKYRDSVADFRLPEGVDKPVIVGEFHFGALDRGMFHTGLRPVANQQGRAVAYKRYVEGALENPWLVGTHWFQYGDQATTGRGDGENYQIGFLDTWDTPYPETIRASRQVGSQMYRLRSEKP